VVVGRTSRFQPQRHMIALAAAGCKSLLGRSKRLFVRLFGVQTATKLFELIGVAWQTSQCSPTRACFDERGVAQRRVRAVWSHGPTIVPAKAQPPADLLAPGHHAIRHAIVLAAVNAAPTQATTRPS
jgi:hypothetical protein